jgi:Fe-S cluster assembly ATP-binding protein
MLEIKDLHAVCDEKVILKGVNLKVKAGEIHAIMGPNGAGKSTLAKVVAGHPLYEVTQGEIWFNGVNVLELEPEARVHLGLFMSFQYPPEIAGVTNEQFLRESYNAVRAAKKEVTLDEKAFAALLEEKMQAIEMRPEFKQRAVNEGFSGGEKKRNEILQMALLDPRVSILDETDSGLDIDAMRVIACGVKRLMDADKALILITHYQRLLDYIRPHFVHVLLDGKIVLTGGYELALELESKGYDWLGKHETLH